MTGTTPMTPRAPRRRRTPISDGLGKPWVFRQKDIWNFWQQAHYERVGGAELSSHTAWVPQGKPIWLTELGCPAVDKGANQPSVFPDPKSSESGLPYFSNGARDDLMQRRHLQAVLGALDPAFGADALNPVSSVYGGRMIAPDAIHLWTWDARPYPVFPASVDVWSDAPNWETGHWLTGRLGAAPLDALVSTILADSGMTDADTGDLGEGPAGYVVDRPMAPRAMLDPLALAFAFDAAEQDGVLRFRQRGGEPAVEFVEDDLILPDDTASARLTRAQESDLPREVSIGFTNIGNDYQARDRDFAPAGRRLDAQGACRPRDGDGRQRSRAARGNLAAGSVGRPRNRGIRAAAEQAVARARRRGGADRQRAAAADRDPGNLRHRKPRRAGALDRSGSVRSGAGAGQPPRARPPPAIGPVHAQLLDLPTLDPSSRRCWRASRCSPIPGPAPRRCGARPMAQASSARA